jgi:leucyl aminopeptidase
MKIELRGGKPGEAAQFAVDVLVVPAFARDAKKDAKGTDAPRSKVAAKRGARSTSVTPKAAAPWAPNPTLDALDATLGGAISAAAAREEFAGKANTSLSVATLGRAPARTILVVGLGAPGETPKASALRSFAARGGRAANVERARSFAIVAPSDDAATVRAIAEGLPLGTYRFTTHLTGDRIPKARVDVATIFVAKVAADLREAVRVGAAVGDAVCLTRDLVSEPPNVLDAPELARRAQRVAKAGGLSIKVFDKAEIKRRKMHLLMAVNQGSTTEPRFVHMTYAPKAKRGAAKPKRVVVVGKGLTFDSGGLCIKPADGMLDMKIDMSGAANVVGLMAAVAAVQPNVEVHGIFAATDNMPDGNAYRPGDIWGSLDGKTVEIINTDAEGRLVLADALAYARVLQPDVMIDNATLTGACMVALGTNCSGYYSNREELVAPFEAACKTAGEQMWRMPLLEDLKDQLKSDNADLKHMGARWGGSITAALFLREFIGDTAWIHCDIAGPVMTDKPSGFYVKGATGHGVLSFLAFIEQLGR